MRHKKRSEHPVAGDLPDVFVSHAREDEKVQYIQSEVQAVVKACFPHVGAFTREIETLGLPIITASSDLQVKLALLVTGSNAGLIFPDTEKYDKLVQHLRKHFPEKENCDYTHGVMILYKDSVQFSILAYELYHWFSWRNGLKGYTRRSRELYEVFNQKHQSQLPSSFLDKLSSSDTQALKLAIRRDREALQFLRQLMDEVFIPGNNARMLEDGEAQA